MSNSLFNKIGWIGTGVMGKSMCKHLLNSGYNLSIYNRTASKTEELVSLGATFSNPTQIAQNCDVVFLMLGYPRDVEEMTFGTDNTDGILKHMKPGSYLIDHTTSSPDLAVKISNEALKKGIYSFDAPVSGGDIGAKNGKLVVMAGGDKSKFSEVETIMQKYSGNIKIMGDAGKGQHTKMANQVVIASSMIGLVEGMVYGHKAGLDLEAMLGLIGTGAAGSFSMNAYGPRILKGDLEPGFYIEHFVKDLEIALAECGNMGLKLQGLELAHKFYKELVEADYGRKGTQALVIALQKINNVEIVKV